MEKFEKGILTCGCLDLYYEYDDGYDIHICDPDGLDVDDAYVVTDHEEYFRVFAIREDADTDAERLRNDDANSIVVVYPYYIGKKLMIRHFLKHYAERKHCE